MFSTISNCWSTVRTASRCARYGLFSGALIASGVVTGAYYGIRDVASHALDNARNSSFVPPVSTLAAMTKEVVQVAAKDNSPGMTTPQKLVVTAVILAAAAVTLYLCTPDNPAENKKANNADNKNQLKDITTEVPTQTVAPRMGRSSE